MKKSKKLYKRPELTKVKLTPEEALLTACKAASAKPSPCMATGSPGTCVNIDQGT